MMSVKNLAFICLDYSVVFCKIFFLKGLSFL